MNNLPRMRGIRQAVEEIKTADPKTALTEKALRRLILSGVIPSVVVGRKYLINLDTLERYLSGETVKEDRQENGGIRVISETKGGF